MPQVRLNTALPITTVDCRVTAADANELEIYAALDLGSNSFHLLLAAFQGGRLVVVDRHKEMVRLAAGLTPDGLLAEEAMQRALTVLPRFAERLRGVAPDHVRVVGTNTLRVARNGDAFLERAEALLGVPINVIKGVEEARLIYLGVATDFTPEDRSRLVIDIGGGSTELVLGRERPLQLESLYMGCVSSSRRYFPGGKLSRRRFQQAVLAARAEIQPVANRFTRSQWDEAVGSSGTIRAIERILGRMGLSPEHAITPAALRVLVDRMLASDHSDRLDLPGLDSERRPVFAGGLAVLQAFFEELDIDALQVSGYAIREGIIYDLAGRLHHRDKRQETIELMSDQYHVDRGQARRISELALCLLGQVEQDLATPPDLARRLLGWAISLHEIGLAIAHSSYQKHGAYILAQSDMAGFSRQEQRLLSFLVQNHRRKPRLEPKGYGFEPDWRLVVVMRLACLFNRRRDQSLVLDSLRLSFSGDRCRLQLPRGWRREHPLTDEDLRQEARFLRSVRLQLECAEA